MSEDPRKKLSKLVREQFWDTDTGWKLQNELMQKARSLISKKYEECLKGDKPIAQCFREKAEEASLDKAYRGIWGEGF